MDLERWLKKDMLRITASRPTRTGLESHLAAMHRELDEFAPSIVVVDPITNLISAGELSAVKSMLTRLIDYLKMQRITAMFTNLNVEGEATMNTTEISSLMDVWLLVRSIEKGNTRNRVISVLKARGMAHSPGIYEMEITDDGIEVVANNERPLKAAANE